MSVLVNLIVMLGMLVVVPAGLRLIDAAGSRPFGGSGRCSPSRERSLSGCRARRPRRCSRPCTRSARWPSPLQAPRRLARTRSLAPAEIAVLTALVTPSVAGIALVAERSGHELFGFSLPILALTVPHFHFAGFAAALVAGLVCRTSAAPAGRFAALSVPLGTLLVLAGYFLDDWAELLGALVLTAGMWAVALLTWRDVRTGGRDRFTRALLAVSAAVLVATMLLALSWALGEATGLPHPTLTWMAATHGLGNALGFALCSVLAWRRLKETAA